MDWNSDAFSEADLIDAMNEDRVFASDDTAIKVFTQADVEYLKEMHICL